MTSPSTDREDSDPGERDTATAPYHTSMHRHSTRTERENLLTKGDNEELPISRAP